jgi:hypothetical protein
LAVLQLRRLDSSEETLLQFEAHVLGKMQGGKREDGLLGIEEVLTRISGFIDVDRFHAT